MQGWISVVMLSAASACTVDTTGLQNPDTGIRLDANVRRDSGPTDAAVADTPHDTIAPDVIEDAPVIQPDVPLDVFDAGPLIPDVCDDPDLVVCYLFDGNALDSSGNARHLNAAAVTYVDGAVDGAVSLTADSRIHLPGVRFSLTAGFSFELWYHQAGALEHSNQRWGILDIDGFASAFALPSNADGQTSLQTSTLARSIRRRAGTSGWHHLVVVSTETSMAATLDGSLIEVMESASPDDLGDLHIGSNSNSDPMSFEDNFIGEIDHIRIWDRTLSPVEVEALF